jgi:hypothetical protein
MPEEKYSTHRHQHVLTMMMRLLAVKILIKFATDNFVQIR